MWMLLLVFAAPHQVSGVVTLQQTTSAQDTAYSYHGGHSSGPDTISSLYYTPLMNYYQNDEPKYLHGHNGELCTLGKSFMHQVLEIVAAKFSLLSITKAAVTAVGAGFLTKLPLILLKLTALPVGLIILGLPLLLPILALFVPIPILTHNSHDTHYDPSRQGEETLSKAIRNLLDSEECIGRLACELGRMNSESEYKKPISWLLEYMERSAADNRQEILAVYRTAYLQGNAGDSCQYQCDLALILGGQDT